MVPNSFCNLYEMGVRKGCTVEDTILRKLEWYRARGEASERQWSDLRGVLKVSGPRLDLDYLRHWAPFLKVKDLLERLLVE